MLYRLSLSISPKNIGWVCSELKPESLGHSLTGKIIATGVRAFSDGREPSVIDRKTGMTKLGAPLCEARRAARSARRLRDRRQRAYHKLMGMLLSFGLLTKPEKGYIADVSINPYAARSQAANEPVDAATLGRALAHLFRRRGFKSNRKAKAQEDAMRIGQIKVLAQHLKTNNQTLGQWMYERLLQGEHVRIRGAEMLVDEQGNESQIFVSRQMYMDEFNAIRKAQGTTLLNAEQWDALESAYSFQRDLKDPAIGTCVFENGLKGEQQPRASNHLPISQRFRILRHVNSLKYYAGSGQKHSLNTQQRETLVSALEQHPRLTFNRIRKLLNIDSKYEFNLEYDFHDFLRGNETSCTLRKIFSNHGSDWDVLPDDVQNDLVQHLVDIADDDQLNEINMVRWKLPQPLFDSLLEIEFVYDYNQLSITAMNRLLPLLRNGASYTEAVFKVYGVRLGDARFCTGTPVTALPYYGEVFFDETTSIVHTPTSSEDEKAYGRIPNPTIHIALNQLRKLVNRLVATYGNPVDIHLVLPTEMKYFGKSFIKLLKKRVMSMKTDEELEKRFMEAFSREPSNMERERMRLWRELPLADDKENRVDIFTGKEIAFNDIFGKNHAVGHILPYEMTFDGSPGNKILTSADLNLKRGDTPPFEFAEEEHTLEASVMAERALRFLGEKGQLFQQFPLEGLYKNIIKKLPNQEIAVFQEDPTPYILDHRLRDKHYITNIFARYLSMLVAVPQRVVPVKSGVVNIMRTAMEKAGIEPFGDLRDSALQAMYAAMSSTDMFLSMAAITREKRTALQSKDNDFASTGRVALPDVPSWATNRRWLDKIADILVSHRQEHGLQGRMFKETAYGVLSKETPEGYNATQRCSVTSLTEKDISTICSPSIRKTIEEFVEKQEYKGKSWKDKMELLANTRVRIGKSNTLTYIRKVKIYVKDNSITPIASAPYKGYCLDSTVFCDIWRVQKKSKAGNDRDTYEGHFVSRQSAIKYKDDPIGLRKEAGVHPALAKKVMRLYKRDCVELEIENERLLFTVVLLGRSSGKIGLRPLNCSNTEEDRTFAVNKLMGKLKMRKVNFGIDGKIQYV